MKRKIRNGNDVPIVWTLIDEHNLPYTVEGKDVQVEMKVGTSRIQVKEFTLSGNEISFTYYGKDQVASGNVVLIYYENRGKVGMVTYDTKDDTFEMVEHSWQAVDSDEAEGQVTVESVTIRSQVVAGGGGSTIVVDNYMSPISENPVQNKVITEALGTKQDTLQSGENIKTINGQSLLGEGDIQIQGGGVVVVDSELSTTSENPVQNKVVTNALNGKQDTIDNLSEIREGASAGASAYQKPPTGIPSTDLADGVIPDISGKQDKMAIVTDGGATQELANNTEYRYLTATATLNITAPANPANDYFAWLVFVSGSTATALNYPSSWKWSGDDVNNGSFVPAASKTYNVVVWFDGININAKTMGV